MIVLRTACCVLRRGIGRSHDWLTERIHAYTY